MQHLNHAANIIIILTINKYNVSILIQYIISSYIAYNTSYFFGISASWY